MEVKVINSRGQSAKSVQLPDSIFAVPMNEHVLHTVIKAYRANSRQGTHATKTKGMISGGGKKPFKQKGTGEARQGSSRSPLMPGGGVIHGPQPRCYREKTNKNLRQLALKIALSDKLRHGCLTVVSDVPLSEFSSKKLCQMIKTWKIEGSLTISDERKDQFLSGSSRNVRDVDAITPAGLNAMNVLRRSHLVLSETALEVVLQRLQDEKGTAV